MRNVEANELCVFIILCSPITKLFAGGNYSAHRALMNEGCVFITAVGGGGEWSTCETIYYDHTPV